MPLRTIILDRMLYDPRGTPGRLRVLGWSCFTLEEVWKSNRPHISCIPPGWYHIKRDTFKGQYPNFAVANPPYGRSAIELHIGNTLVNTEGCIMLGESLSLGSSSFTLLESKKAFERFMGWMDGLNEAILVIRGEP